MHRLAHSLSLLKYESFPSWNTLTGCDTVSSFHGKGEISAWETWKCYPEATEVFVELSNPVDGVLSDNCISATERFVCLMYDKATSISNVNDCRRMLFTKKVELSVTYRQLEMLRFNTLKEQYTRVGNVVTNMLRYNLFCTISLIVFIFRT